MRRALLFCGILSSLAQILANAIVPFYFPGYDISSQTVSELSAIGAPTSEMWRALMVPYALFGLAFAVGIWMAAGTSRALRAAAVFAFANIAFGMFWPPMHLRGEQFTLTDTLHIVWTAIVVPLMMLQIVFGALAFGRYFRIYSFLTIAAMIGFGVLTSIYAPNIATNGPTPLIGIWERLGMAAQTIWIVVFAVALLRRE